MVLNEKDWEKQTPEQRDWLVFNTLQAMNERLKIIEGRKLFDRTCSFLGGVVGGVAAMIGGKLIR
jgi:hypothetical protein